MSNGPERLSAVVGITCAIFLASLLFISGFLAIRSAVDTKSTCHDPPAAPTLKHPSADSCWLPQRLHTRKVIWIVIDALRTDFGLADRASHPDRIAYVNRLRVLSETISKDPRHALMYRFVADPPTATGQRLAGITAGILPTFIEVTENFAGETCPNDNLVYQMLQKDRLSRLFFLGDDTWLSMFPFIAERTKGEVAGYHSFHLFDLHTVDSAVREHIFPILAAKSYDVVIAHFLGLDHCGHKFGPTHLHCGEKLEEMDTVLRSVMDKMDSDSVLFVMGDHGMTEEGDHGGVSPREASSLLFVYSPGAPFYPSLQTETDYWKAFYRRVRDTSEADFSRDDLRFYSPSFDESVLAATINQIDFAPTLALLLGLPIPFGNIGTLSPELLFDEFPYERLDKLCAEKGCQPEEASFLLQLARLHNHHRLAEAARLNLHQIMRYFKSLEGQRGFARSTLQAILLKVAACDSDLERRLKLDERLLALDMQTAPDITLQQLEELNLFLESIFHRYLVILVSVQRHCRAVWASFRFPFMNAGLVGALVGCLALSLVIWVRLKNALSVHSVFPLALAAIHAAGLSTTSFIKFEDSVVQFILMSLIVYHCLARPAVNNVGKAVLLIGLVRFSSITGICREEQFPFCQVFHHRNVMPSVSVIALGLVGMGVAVYRFFRFWKHDSSRDRLQLGVYSAAISCLGVHWMWTWLSDTGHLVENAGLFDSLVLIFLPRLLYVLTSGLLACSLFRRKDMSPSCLRWSVTTSVAMMAGIVLRPFGGWLVLCVGVPMVDLGLELLKEDGPMMMAVFAQFAGLQLFFASGHQATISSIQWECVFIGFREAYSQLLSVVLLLLNSFCGPALASLALGLESRDASLIAIGLGAWNLAVFTLFIPFLLRHLMIWQIFTPRFLMQVFVTGITCLISIISIKVIVPERHCVALSVLTNHGS